jgi:TRAP-type C4-dicarboxylate transport system permease small subunit
VHGIFDWVSRALGELKAYFRKKGGALQRVARIIWEMPLSLQRVVMVTLAVFLSFLVVIEVAVRYYVHQPILWVEELALFLVFWFYFTGGVYATYKRSHITGGVLHLFLRNKPRVLGSFRIAAALLSFGLCCLCIFLSYNLFTYSLKMDLRTIHLFLPVAYARLSLFITFPLMAFYFLVDLIGSIRNLVRGVYTTTTGSTQ